MENINLKNQVKMGQGDVLEILEKQMKPLSVPEIAEIMDHTNPKKVFTLIKKLLESNDISCLEIPRQLAMKMYKCKRRMRLYYVA